MRICFISRRYFPAVSGMSVYARNLTHALADRGHEVVMISQYREDPTGVEIYGGGPPPNEPWMEVHGLRSVGEELGAENPPADFERDLREMADLAVKLHAEKPFDVVHAQYAYPTGLAALEVSRRLGIPNVVSIQGGDGHWVGGCCTTHQRAMDAVLNHAMGLAIGCDSFRAEVVENHGTDPNRFTIVPGATNVDQFTPQQEKHSDLAAAVAEIGQLGEPVRLLYHGRVDKRKGSLDFIYCGARLLKEGRNVEMIVSGIGPDFVETRELAEELGVIDKTHFPGEAAYDEAHLRYHDGDIFLSPTYAEGFSNTILEAMASGLPIVSTKTVGVVDCLRDGENGLLVEPGDLDALTAATRRLLDDETLRTKLARAAYQEVQEKYSWPVVGEQIEGLYERLQGQKVDTSWTKIIQANEVVEDADLSCRFRTQPHLL
ncbi:glycosyltransferase family 4 protein [Neolewinella antarctica]|uniref:Glycosyltransferase involved in cell wall biosynthesis n=1 Tax=Neolewinella antarctica TaxID=442734 RepID=A0ABX0XFR8_9BACT|nr:glycosyltransferase family 4 protein [Neolewinella antarctica]NJC28164.1 glycosyltransferase involved in cell wall biosynthesis [Neolewinella antarctica]